MRKSTQVCAEIQTTVKNKTNRPSNSHPSAMHVQERSWIRYRRYRYDIDKVLSISIPAHCDEIVDIVTISTHILTISSISKRYRQDFVNIDTSALWRYRRYRYVRIGDHTQSNTQPQNRGGVTKPRGTSYNFDKVWRGAPDGRFGKYFIIRDANNLDNKLNSLNQYSICILF